MHFHPVAHVPPPRDASARQLGAAECLLLPLQAGRLLSIKQQAHQAQQFAHDKQTGNQRQYDAAGGEGRLPKNAATRAEPINYLRLRRTEESARALQRNRAVVASEILQPARSVSQDRSNQRRESRARLDDKLLSVKEQQETLVQMDRVLEELEKRVLRGKDRAAVSDTGASTTSLAVELQRLYHRQVELVKETNAAQQRVQRILTVVRNDISLMYKFTPLFKIYALQKVKSAIHRWTRFVAWHREEQARLALLWPYAVTIQRIFRTKRDQWRRARERLTLAWEMWESSIILQRCARRWLAKQKRDRLVETQHATKLQAAWRGRHDRRLVKRLLKEQLRLMLRSLTPTGNLHRLHEVIQRNPELAKPLNMMLSLIEETTVTVDANSVYKARNAKIASKIAARPVEATTKQLFHAIFELSGIILYRRRVVELNKLYYASNLQEKLEMQRQDEEESKSRKLVAARERIKEQAESANMKREELLTWEYVRMSRTIENDRVLRLKIQVKRQEEAENSRMIVEEYQIRYTISEIRRRKANDIKRLREVEKRHQFLQEQEQQQVSLLMEMLKTNELKRNEIQTKRTRARAEEQELWARMSKEQQNEALRRLELREKEEEEERKRIEAVMVAQAAQQIEMVRRREDSRRRKQEELECELAARKSMEAEEQLSRRVHFEMKKTLQAELWKAKREKELMRYSLDPMHYAKIQAVKELEERQRKESYLMKKEDELALSIHSKERKKRYFEACREQRRIVVADVKRAQKECELMGREDEISDEFRRDEMKTIQHKRVLEEMNILARRNELKKHQQLHEARGRKEMYKEEMEQRRIEQAIRILQELREKYERELMGQEERLRRDADTHITRKVEKRFRERCNLEMMKEDVASMQRQDWEDEGHRLEDLLWRAADIAAFKNLVTDYPRFLATNVSTLKEITGVLGLPPFDLDYDAVQQHRHTESSLSPDQVPRKRRKRKRFFYHEFFEEDPILAKYQPAPAPPSKARERWKRVAEHFFGQTWSSDSVRTAYLLMSQNKYDDAAIALLEAVRMIETSPAKRGAASLYRHVARCYMKHWEQKLVRDSLETSLRFYHKAGSHVAMLTNPHYLQEIALALERMGRYREAAEVISGVIGCFPRYSNLYEVIFRGGIIMISLKMYQQSRDYLLHTLDKPPFGWEQHDVVLLTARVMQLEGKARRKLCSVAYEEAFRTNKRDAYYRIYPTWKEWIKAPASWRDLGDRYYARNEYFLARDAYHVMMKRLMKRTPARTRQHVLQAERQLANPNDERVESHGHDLFEDEDWLRVARCAAALNDRQEAAHALRRWFARKPYQDRVLVQFYAWPLARWKLLGVEVPQKVLDALGRKKQELEDAQTTKLRAVEEKRQQVLRQRSLKARERAIAWADAEPTQHTKNPAGESQPERLDAWIRVQEENRVYYWNEESGDVSWDPPTV